MKLTVPTLLLDKEKCLANLKMMHAKAERSGVRFRPHFKTHQSIKVGEWIRDLGVEHCTTSSVRMAGYFANWGWKDITVAFPFNVHETSTVNLFPESVTINLCVLSAGTVAAIDGKLSRPVNVFIKIDSGYHRTGIPSEDTAAIDQVLAAIEQAKNISFKGFLAHDGHSYGAANTGVIQLIHDSTMKQMLELKTQYVGRYPNVELSIGDTPTCSVCDNFEGMTEMRPGNFVLYDMMMVQLGACTIDQVAACMAVPVVAKHPEELKVIVYGGGVHFSKDALTNEYGEKEFGKVVGLNEGGWTSPIPGWKVVSLSQEHGILQADSEELFNTMNLGDFIGILPVHSCMTASCMKGFTTLDGEAIDHLDGMYAAL
jgi:D-serine deaminase-like pyridoxal phosphate-dependent protein